MSITYLEAIREAQARLLREDERVFIYGQDVGGTFGGAFKATKGLAKEFPNRVLNTPISEDAIVGTAIGAAIKGMRPIVEMQFADFSSTALNQILNHAGTHYWRTNISRLQLSIFARSNRSIPTRCWRQLRGRGVCFASANRSPGAARPRK